VDTFITLAVEDSLSEAVARKMLFQSEKNYSVVNCLGGKGFGYLKVKINAFNKAAKALPFFIIADQDRGCPPDKIKSWLNQKAHSNLLFRIAVMEIESWVMADRKAFADFLSISVANIPHELDEIEDPKKFLITKAKKSRSIRMVEDMVPALGSTAKVGPNYNARLIEFVRNNWNVLEAVNYSESLSRAFLRLQEFKRKKKE
jgi:hypothetical protein